MNTDLQVRAEQFTLLKLLGSQKQLLGQPLERLVLVMGKHHTTEVAQDLGVLNRVLSCGGRVAVNVSNRQWAWWHIYLLLYALNLGNVRHFPQKRSCVLNQQP